MINIQGRKGITAEELRNAFAASLDAAQKTVEIFKAALDNDPRDAMAWSRPMFRMVAEIDLLKRLLLILEQPHPVENVGESLLQIVVLGSERGEDHRNHEFNAIDRAEMQAAAALLKRYYYN